MVNDGLTYDGYVSGEVAAKPSKKKFTAHEKNRESWKKNAQKASDRLDNPMKKSHERKNPTSYTKRVTRFFLNVKIEGVESLRDI